MLNDITLLSHDLVPSCLTSAASTLPFTHPILHLKETFFCRIMLDYIDWAFSRRQMLLHSLSYLVKKKIAHQDRHDLSFQEKLSNLPTRESPVRGLSRAQICVYVPKLFLLDYAAFPETLHTFTSLHMLFLHSGMFFHFYLFESQHSFFKSV